MLRFTERFGHDSQAELPGTVGRESRLGTERRTGPINRARRRRNQRLDCEALPSRQLLSGYYIVNAASGKVLDDPAFSTSNGALIDQYQPNGGTNQLWNLASPTGVEEIVNASSGKVLDDPAYSTSNGALIDQYQPNGGSNQLWNVVPLADGNDWILNVYSGKVLDDPASSTSNGTTIQQTQLTFGANQEWKLLAAGSGPVATNYIVNASSGGVLDPGSSTSNGAPILQDSLNLGATQRWVFIPLASSNLLTPGNYLIVNASSGEVLDDPAFSTGNGAGIDQYQLNGGLNQQWRIVAQSNGNDEVFNAFSGGVLDDPAFSTSDGTQIVQYQLNGGTNQQWSISPLADPAASAAYSPAPASTPLFNIGGPSYLDVRQGQVGDCWLLASLAEVAARDPQDIKNMFTWDGIGTENGVTVSLYSVRFFKSDGSAFQVVVDTDLPGGGGTYDQIHNDLGTQVLWVALAEKAYAEANALGYVSTSHLDQDSYNALETGQANWALQAITGKPSNVYNVNPTNIATAWNSGELIVLGTGDNPTSSYIVAKHAYAVVGYNPADPQFPFEVFNPWGTDSSGWAPGGANQTFGLFPTTAAFISQNFIFQFQGTGAINVNDLAGSTNGLTESATLGDGYAASGTINIAQYRPVGSAVGAKTASGYLGNKMGIGYTRPAQATAIGTDRGEDRHDDGNDTTASDLNDLAEGIVVSITSPTLTSTRKDHRKS